MNTLTIDRNDLGDFVAYDGCHKFYVLADHAEYDEVKSYGYTIYNIAQLPALWETACFLRFINPWDLKTDIVPQDRECDTLVFTNFGKADIVYHGEDA